MNVPSWDNHASAPSQCQLLASLVRCQMPNVLVESGTYRGHMAIHIGSVLDELSHGHLHTSDPIMYCPANMGERVTYYQKDFLDMLDLIPGQIDFAYIDGTDHSRPNGADLRWIHFKAVQERLRPGGIICVDDTAADDWSDGENGQSVLRIRKMCGNNFKFLRGLSVYSR
jgi:predicted O-methyltransferase YrrM